MAESTEPNDLKLGDYDIIEQIGQGGMGTVFKAIHRELDKIVAIKKLNSQSGNNEQAEERFKREIKAIGRLDHPNIVRATDARMIGDTRFLVTEFVEGKDLSKLVSRQGPLPVPVACEIIRQVAQGLTHAHIHEIIHRDIKPLNVMLTPMGIVKILDLGLARLNEEKSELTRETQVLGTLDYMAPEQIATNATIDHRADIYAMGCTLYFLVTGRPPFYSIKESIKKMMAQVNEPPKSFEELGLELPPELWTITSGMLTKSKSRRTASAREVSDSMKAFLDQAAWLDFTEKFQSEFDLSESHGGHVAPELPDAPVSSQKRTETRNQRAGSTKDAPSTPNFNITVNEQKPYVQKQKQTRTGLVFGVAIISGVLLVLLTLGIVFSLQTEKGSLIVEADQEVAASFRGGEINLLDSDSKEPLEVSIGATKSIKTGKYELSNSRKYEILVLDPETGKFVSSGSAFNIKKNGNTRIKLSLRSAKPKQATTETTNPKENLSQSKLATSKLKKFDASQTKTPRINPVDPIAPNSIEAKVAQLVWQFEGNVFVASPDSGKDKLALTVNELTSDCQIKAVALFFRRSIPREFAELIQLVSQLKQIDSLKIMVGSMGQQIGVGYTNDILKDIAKIDSLTSLVLYGLCDDLHAGLAEVANLPKLKSLELSSPIEQPGYISALANSNLDALIIHDHLVNAELLEEFVQFKKLKRIGLGHFVLKDSATKKVSDGLRGLAKIDTLESLSFYKFHLQEPANWEILRDFPNLKHVQCFATNIDEALLKELNTPDDSK